MIRYENDCVGCHEELGCTYELCPYYRVAHLYCDECGNEVDVLYDDGEELCIDCLLKYIPKITVK